MPTTSSTIRVLRWPKAEVVTSAARDWAAKLGQAREELVAIGYIGSYARGDWGVGSDLDVVLVINESTDAFHERALRFDSPRLPVPVEMLVYTRAEFERLRSEPTRFGAVLRDELKWLWRREPMGDNTAQI